MVEGKNRKGLFDMYEDLGEKEERELRLERDAREGENVEAVDMDPTQILSPGKTIEKTLSVPNGSYEVRLKARARAAYAAYASSTWSFEAQKEQIFESPFLKEDWEEHDSGWRGGAEVEDGTLRLSFVWAKSWYGPLRAGYVDWVEFYYRKVDG